MLRKKLKFKMKCWKLNKSKDMLKPNINRGDCLLVRIKQKNTTEPSLIFCDKIEYMHIKKGEFFDHHLMFFYKNQLIFKIWLPNEPEDKEFKDIFEALKSVEMDVVDLSR